MKKIVATILVEDWGEGGGTLKSCVPWVPENINQALLISLKV